MEAEAIDAEASAFAFLVFLAFLAGMEASADAMAEPDALADAIADGADAFAEGAEACAKATEANRPATRAAINFFILVPSCISVYRE